MHNRCTQAVVIALGAAFALQLPAGAQRGGGADPVRFPTQAQFEASAEAQKHVAAARKIAGVDLAKEFENTCSAKGPQRVALARETAGLPPLKDYTVEPTKVFDNMNRLQSVVKDYALKMNAEGLFNTHPGIYQDTLADMETIRKNPTGPNPLLYGRDRAARYWSMILECAEARVIALEEGVKSRS
jgi:hypothetical protein